jgi:dienelactone hydrolase
MATGSYRLVTLSHGLGNLRASYTAFAIDLASHGIVVAAIDHPYGGLAVTPFGRVLAAGDDSTNWDDIPTHARRMEEWATDIRFVLDWLAGAPPGIAGAVSRGVDWRRVGAIGHSSGGLAAIQAASRSDRIRVAIDIDGGLVSPEGTPLAAFVREGFTRPTLIVKSHPIYSEKDLKKRGKTQAQYDAAAKAAEAALDSVPKGPTSPVFTASIAGTGHMSFSDAPFLMPTTITRFGGKVIEPGARLCRHERRRDGVPRRVPAHGTRTAADRDGPADDARAVPRGDAAPGPLSARRRAARAIAQCNRARNGASRAESRTATK